MALDCGMMSSDWRAFRSSLSVRETELAELAAAGYPSKEIASRLTIAPDTVKTHLRNIFRKCGVRSRAELAAWWWGNGQALVATRVQVASGCATQAAEVRGWKVSARAMVLLTAIILVAAVSASSGSSNFQSVFKSDVVEIVDVGATYWSSDGRKVIERTAAGCEQMRPEGGIHVYVCPEPAVTR